MRLKERGYPVPENFIITPEMRAWAKEKGINDATIDFETEKFLDHGREIGRLCRDWRAAWRNWLRKHLEIREERPWGGFGSAKVKQPKRLN